MSINTSQRLTNLYNTFKEFDVTFNKEVIKVTGLDNKSVFLKCMGEQWPCIIYSTSMVGAKIIANINEKGFKRIREANNLVSLKYSFIQDTRDTPMAFFVSAKVSGFTPYNKEKPNLHFINISFTQRPSDDLILILGSLLEANINSIRRKDERIQINQDSMRKLGIRHNEATLYVDTVPRKCILRDLAFGGSKLIIVGVAKFLVDKEVLLELPFQNNQLMRIKGKVVRYEPVEGHRNLAAIAIEYLANSIPMSYKTNLNDYLNYLRTSPKGLQ